MVAPGCCKKAQLLYVPATQATAHEDLCTKHFLQILWLVTCMHPLTLRMKPKKKKTGKCIKCSKKLRLHSINTRTQA